MQNPVIVVPGIQGSGLDDFYPLPSEEVWSAIEHKDFDRIALHPDNVRYEAREPARVQPRSPFPVAYKDLVEALRHDLSEKADTPTPVYPFGYDWRQDCSKSADQLAVFIDEVLERTWLLPHYRNQADRRVDLVGHSMGGLLIADYLARKGGAEVRRVVTIATPYFGSLEAVKKMTSGLGSLAGENPRDREREAARTMPALYQLLPTFAGAIKSSKGLNTDLLDPPTWQPSILRTLAEWVRLNQAQADPLQLFKSHLAGLKRLRQSVASLAGAPLPVEWLAIVGIGSKTQLEADIILWPTSGRRQDPCFDFPAEENDHPNPNAGRTGDGTVPLPAACPPFLKKESLVCVTPEDFSFWEIKDRALLQLAGFHAILPTMNLVQRLTLKFLRTKYSGDVWGHTAPGVARPSWPSWLTDVRTP